MRYNYKSYRTNKSATNPNEWIYACIGWRIQLFAFTYICLVFCATMWGRQSIFMVLLSFRLSHITSRTNVYHYYQRWPMCLHNHGGETKKKEANRVERKKILFCLVKWHRDYEVGVRHEHDFCSPNCEYHFYFQMLHEYTFAIGVCTHTANRTTCECMTLGCWVCAHPHNS